MPISEVKKAEGMRLEQWHKIRHHLDDHVVGIIRLTIQYVKNTESRKTATDLLEANEWVVMDTAIIPPPQQLQQDEEYSDPRIEGLDGVYDQQPAVPDQPDMPPPVEEEIIAPVDVNIKVDLEEERLFEEFLREWNRCHLCRNVFPSDQIDTMDVSASRVSGFIWVV